MIVRGFRKDAFDNDVLTDIFDIVEFTYTGKDMGERSITATFYWPSPVDFKMGDYVEMQMQSLVRGDGLEGDISMIEKFYIYTMPTIKKTARPMEHGQAFEHTVVFYPAQYELGLVQMRDMGTDIGGNNVIYSGFDTVSLFCGANELMQYIMRVLKLAYHDSVGDPLWNYIIASEVDESKNTALERHSLTFSSNTVMDALLKLNDTEGINTTFFINDRTIYVGFKRPYFCRVTDAGTLDNNVDTQMFNFQYGKTSHESIAINHGCVYDVTKSIGKETPITKLFAYGASRNLNRYYCSDKIGGGRYVNRLMLPSFSADGVTDYILSENVDKYGIREGSKQFEDIYPSIQYVTYGDIRQIQYCIKVKAAGYAGDDLSDQNGIARVQCYKVVESPTTGVNMLVEAAPPDDIAVYVHALGKVVKVVLFGGIDNDTAIAKQVLHDVKVPTRTKGGKDYIPGACFLVHDDSFADSHASHLCTRANWFTYIPTENAESATGFTTDQVAEISLHQINYSDTFWITDLYKFTSYVQTNFDRTGYSAWAYPKLNNRYVSLAGDANDSLLVNEIVDIEPVVVEDTSANVVGVGINKNQQTFDLYLRDLGFKIDEQNDFGERVFVYGGTVKVSILDGSLEGQEFEIPEVVSDSNLTCVCAFNEDGSINPDFFIGSEYTGSEVPQRAFENGAIWRLRCIRTNIDAEFSNLNIALPNSYIHAVPGDHLTILDIFMPDIYIMAAENRLLKEARRYLQANDNSSVAYSVNLDAVRIQQVPAYALQMREGLNLRMVDSDLGIATENRVVKIFDGPLASNTSMMETTYDSSPSSTYYYEITYRDFAYIEDKLMNFKVDEEENIYTLSPLSRIVLNPLTGNVLEGIFTARVTKEDYDKCVGSGGTHEFFVKDNQMRFRIYRYIGWEFDEGGISKSKMAPKDIFFNFNVLDLSAAEVSKYEHILTGRCTITLNASDLERYKRVSGGNTYYLNGVIEYSIRSKIEYDSNVYTPNTHLLPKGTVVYAPTKVLTDFKNNKHYQIKMEAHNEKNLLLNSAGNPRFVLLNNLDGSLYYEPDCKITKSIIGPNQLELDISFDLHGFNDSIDYYPAIAYESDNMVNYVTTVLVYIIESDVEGSSVINYADFVVQDVSIKVTDSTNRSFSQPIKEISAKLSEQSSATAWVSLMRSIENNRIESAENARISKEIINSARNNYQALLSLKNNIFDPDGTCNDTFLQIMMLQVGADSMNYHLLKTRIGVNGVYYNCFCGPDKEDGGIPHFKVYDADVLNHFVYTSGVQAGTWNIPYGIDVALDGTSTYFVSIKCDMFSNNAQWECSTIQRKVNEDPSCWYFNWGILTCDSAGVYTLIETRGNAYMYGDNLVCGKISNLAKNCWFDLNNGDFVLGNTSSGAALSYIDGVLTISGLPNESEVAKMLAEFDERLSNIGGGNLLNKTSFSYHYVSGALAGFTEIYKLEAGETYIATYQKFENNAGGALNEPFNGVCLIISAGRSFLEADEVVQFGVPFSINKNGRSVYIAWCDYGYATAMKGLDDYGGVETNTAFAQYLDKVMLQKGSIATEFQPSIEEITSQTIGGDNYASVTNYEEVVEDAEATDVIDYIVITSNYNDDKGNVVYDYLPSGDYVFSGRFLITSRDTFASCDIYLQAINSKGEILCSHRINTLTTEDNLAFHVSDDFYARIVYDVRGIPDGAGFDISFRNIMLQMGVRTTAFVDYVSHLTKAFKTSTEIMGGVVATSLINLRDAKGNIIAGMSGLDDSSVDNQGVTLWSGGTYLDALAQSEAHASGTLDSLIKMLPILLTKTGIGSKIGCFEIESANEAAIYSKDRNYRILLSAIDDTGALSIRLQEFGSYNNYEDKIVISNESVDTKIKSQVLRGYGTTGKIVSKADDAMSDVLSTEAVTLDSGTWSTTMSPNHYIQIKYNIDTGYAIRKFRFGPGTLLRLERFDGGLSTVVDVKDIGETYGTVSNKGWVTFRFPLPDLGYSTIQPGTYQFRLYAQYFIRTNGAGIDYQMKNTDKRFTEGNIYFSLEDDVSFTCNDSSDTSQVIRIGNDGIKVNASSSSNFIVKNSTAKSIDVRINGLPRDKEGLPAGSLYLSGNDLKIV